MTNWWVESAVPIESDCSERGVVPMLRVDGVRTDSFAELGARSPVSGDCPQCCLDDDLRAAIGGRCVLVWVGPVGFAISVREARSVWAVRGVADERSWSRCSGLADVRCFDGAAAAEQPIPAEQRNSPKAGFLLIARRSLAAPVSHEPTKEDDAGRGFRHWIEGAAADRGSWFGARRRMWPPSFAYAFSNWSAIARHIACVVDDEGIRAPEVMEREPGERRRLNVV